MKKFVFPGFILLLILFNPTAMFQTDMLKTGDPVPAFVLKDQNNADFSIDSIKGKKPMVIYFYPKDNTPGCTKEACSFRDQYETFQELGAEVIGISSDSPESHKNFIEKYQLPFRLLSDPGEKVRKLFGVKPDLFGLIPGRETFVVDKKGIVIYKFNSQFRIDRHINDAVRILKESIEKND